MKILRIKNIRRGFATNSSSTHSLLYKNEGEIVRDLNIFSLNYYDRMDNTIAASKKAKIKYICAAIYRNPPLLQAMMGLYPEMQEYMHLVQLARESDNTEYNDPNKVEYLFGMYPRGNLYFHNSTLLEANIEIARKIIEDDSIIIVGGSDEDNFVYDWMDSHKAISKPENFQMSFLGNTGIVKNGNYWVGLDYINRNKIRFITGLEDKECIPKYPELIDLKITDRCSNNCPFCYQGSNISGRHAEPEFIGDLVSDLVDPYYPTLVEFAIGGGNILDSPHLEEIFSIIHSDNHIINATINAVDIPRLIDPRLPFLSLFARYVKGLGISVNSLQDVEPLRALARNTKARRDLVSNGGCFFTIHIIPELVGKDTTIQIVRQAGRLGFSNQLFLGYKENNRGATQPWSILNEEELVEIFDAAYIVGVDTTFANRYKPAILNYRFCNLERTVTYVEGEFSMYVDAVNKLAYKSSYQLDKPYNINWRGRGDATNSIGDPITLRQAFQHIREDNGLPNYITRQDLR